MAKANKTAMEELMDWFDDDTYPPTLGEVQYKIKELLIKERQQIQFAFLAGTNGQYDDHDHYYFMEYIDND